MIELGFLFFSLSCVNERSPQRRFRSGQDEAPLSALSGPPKIQLVDYITLPPGFVQSSAGPARKPSAGITCTFLGVSEPRGLIWEVTPSTFSAVTHAGLYASLLSPSVTSSVAVASRWSRSLEAHGAHALWACFFFSDGLDTPLCGQRGALHRKWNVASACGKHPDVGSITPAPFGAHGVTSAAPRKRALRLRGGSAERAPFVDICCRPQLCTRHSAPLGGPLAGSLLRRGLRDTSVHNHVGSTVRQGNS